MKSVRKTFNVFLKQNFDYENRITDYQFPPFFMEITNAMYGKILIKRKNNILHKEELYNEIGFIIILQNRNFSWEKKVARI
jgi:hypothetical protein